MAKEQLQILQICQVQQVRSYIIQFLLLTMFSFLLPIASKIVSDAIDKIPDDAELGEKLIDLCLVILKKAVKLTKTDMDDKLLAQVETAIKAR